MEGHKGIKKLTPDEVRQMYHQNAERIRQESSLDELTWSKLWMALIARSGWGFMDVMKFIQEADAKSGDKQISVHLSVALSNNNLIWKRWFFDEFPDFVRDLNMRWETRTIPFPWLERSRRTFHESKIFNAEDDALFYNVIWRSCYMWAYMFRRQCAKYMLAHLSEWMILHRAFFGMFAQAFGERFFDHNGYYTIEHSIFETKGETHVQFTMPTYPAVFPTPMTFEVPALMIWVPEVKNWMKLSRATPYLVHLMYLSNMIVYRERNRSLAEEHTVTGDARLHPTPPWERLDQHEKEVYNFPVKTIESFIRWYVLQIEDKLIEHGGAPTAIHPFHPLNDIEFESWSDEEAFEAAMLEEEEGIAGPMQQESKVVSLMQSSVDHQLFDRKTQQWQYLENLPLCPRRMKPGKDEYPGLQFLGNQLKPN